MVPPWPAQGAGYALPSLAASPTSDEVWIGGTNLNTNTAVAAPVPVVPDVSGGQVAAANATLSAAGLAGAR